MPARKPMGRIPVIFGDWKDAKKFGQIYEVFMDYENADLWFIGTDGATLIPITKNIKDSLQDFEEETTENIIIINNTIVEVTNTLNTKIDNTKTELNTTIVNTKNELNTKIDNTKKELTTNISNTKTELTNKINTDITNLNTNLRKDLQVKIWRYTIPSNAGWAGSAAPYTLNIALSGMKNTWLPKVYLEEKETTIANRNKVRNEYGKINLVDSYNGGITLMCDKFKPAGANIPIRVEVQNAWV